MRYVTDAWEPLTPTTTHLAKMQRDYGNPHPIEVRHGLAIASLVLLLAAPLGWIVTGKWAVASIVSGAALLLISIAAILTPDSEDEKTLE